jgi:putative SOS response-associated peptidase YedK
MPVILSPADYDLWLDPGFREAAAVSEMLRPFDSGLMRRYAVSERVNSVANDDPECSGRIESSPLAQAGLF